jgi:hypothetical protein
MPITVTAATSTTSLAAKLAANKAKLSGSVPMADFRAPGSYQGVVKSLCVYHNPKTGRVSYRTLVAVNGGGEETVFASVRHSQHYLPMLQALGLGESEDAISVVTEYDYALGEAEKPTSDNTKDQAIIAQLPDIERRLGELFLVPMGAPVQFKVVLKEVGKPASKDNLTNNWPTEPA